jgi:hypothetical protein
MMNYREQPQAVVSAIITRSEVIMRKVRIVITTVIFFTLIFLAGCPLPQDTASTGPAAPGVITFITESAVFTPIITLSAPADVLWTWADGTTSTALAPTKNYGADASRANTLLVTPWSALRRINLGYRVDDGGSSSIERNDADRQVSSVRNLSLAAPYLVEWCSCYSLISSLDFSDFTKLETIECYHTPSLTSINLHNTPALRRACVEECGLSSLDLSESPALEDLRGALNNYPTINFGNIGQHVWHICVRDNPQIQNQNLFANMAQFPTISELFIWNNNQTGALVIPSTSSTRSVSIQAAGNQFATLNLSGALQNAASSGSVYFDNNRLTAVTITGCAQINELTLYNNRLPATNVDQILIDLDSLGRNSTNTPGWAGLRCDLRGNEACTSASITAGESLAAKGWTVYTNNRSFLPPAPATEQTGPTQIDFTTTGDTTSLFIDCSWSAVMEWHWSDGTTTPAIPGQTIVKTGLGSGAHTHFLSLSNGAVLTRFGAASGGNLGAFVSVNGLQNCRNLSIVYAYNENALTTIGRTNGTLVREYHLAGCALPATEMDWVFADAVANGVNNGRIWAPNGGTAASDTNRATLQTRHWTLSY